MTLCLGQMLPVFKSIQIPRRRATTAKDTRRSLAESNEAVFIGVSCVPIYGKDSSESLQAPISRTSFEILSIFQRAFANWEGLSSNRKYSRFRETFGGDFFRSPLSGRATVSSQVPRAKARELRALLGARGPCSLDEHGS